MKRFWIQESLQIDQEHTLSGELFHHIFDVCRQNNGSKFELINGHHEAYFVEVTDVSKKKATVIVKEVRKIQELAKPWITLALCIPKFPVFEAILEKAVELGVYQIQLLYSDQSFIRSNDKAIQGKWDRWDKIIKSATQQSGRGDLLSLLAPRPLKEYAQKINQEPHHGGLFCYEGTGGVGLKESLGQDSSKWQSVSIFIGSEGGFSSSEVEMMSQLGFNPVSLGSQILRVETACLTLVSVLKYELDLFK